MIDLTEMTVSELMELLDNVHGEIRRQSFVQSAERKATDLNRDYLVATGVKQGDPWVQPTGYLNVYPEGWVATHDGKSWTSNYNGNDQEPGVRGWRENVEEGEYPDYVTPPGYEDAYDAGDRVRWTDGLVYECNEDGTTWSPAEAPNRWDLVPE